MDVREFFNRNPVFTHDEFVKYLQSFGPIHERKQDWLLEQHTRGNHITGIRRGLYAVVPRGVDPAEIVVDPYIIASKLAEDAVLAYHTALEFYGKAYSVTNLFTFQTGKRLAPWYFKSVRFKGVLFPKALRRNCNEFFDVNVMERTGINLRITSFERTLVDMLDRPNLGGSWEEIWRSLEMVEFFNIDKVVEYSLLLENSSTVAKVGFFLDQHSESLMVEDKHLEPLKKHRPKSPHYFDRLSKKPNRFLKEWNLVVPVEIIERSWEEVL